MTKRRKKIAQETPIPASLTKKRIEIYLFVVSYYRVSHVSDVITHSQTWDITAASAL